MILNDVVLDLTKGFQVTASTNPAYDDFWRYVEDDLNKSVEDEDFMEVFVDRLCSKELAANIAEAHPYVSQIKFFGDGKSEYYILASSIQKSIRLGRPDDALRHYRDLCHNGQDMQMRHRLRIIILEDVGIADPILCLLSFKLSNNQVPRSAVEYMIIAACSAKKTRIQTHLLMPLFWEGYHGLDSMAQQAINDGVPSWEGPLVPASRFMLDLLLLRGVKYFDESFKGPLRPKAQTKRLTDALIDIFPDPLIQELMLVMATSSIYVPFYVSFAVGFLMSAGEEWEEVGNMFPEPPVEYIGQLSLLSTALDKHTQFGKKGKDSA